MFVLLETPELPYKTLQTKRIVKICDRLSPLADEESEFSLTMTPSYLSCRVLEEQRGCAAEESGLLDFTQWSDDMGQRILDEKVPE